MVDKEVAEQMELFDKKVVSGKTSDSTKKQQDSAVDAGEDAFAQAIEDGKSVRSAQTSRDRANLASKRETLVANTRFKEMQRMLTTGKTADMSDEEKRAFVEEYKKLRNSVGMNEGGLLDEGGMIDEESGNDVPPGSLREEVRDDIPAQLSEGEFVFPADVVRYIGLEKLMMMRQEAKQGLGQMEAMGQMGNSEEATVEDNLPFDMYDLDVEEDDGLKMQTGGFVNPQTGTFTMQQPSTFNVQSQVPTYTPPPIVPGVQTPITPNVPTVKVPTVTTPNVTGATNFYDQLGTTTPGQYDEIKTYTNEAGQTLQIPFIGGNPIYPIPAGYTEGVKDAVQTTQVTQQSQPQQQSVNQDGGEKFDPMTGTAKSTTGGFSLGSIGSSINTNVKDFIETISGSRPDVMKDPSDSTNVTNNALSAIGFDGVEGPLGNISEMAGVTNDFFGGASNISPTSTLGKATAQLGLFQGFSLSPTGGAAVALGNKANEILGTDFNTSGIDFKAASISGNKARTTALNTLGLTSMSQLDAINNQEVNDIIGQAMQAGMEASRKGLNASEAVSSMLSGATNLEKVKNEIYGIKKDNYNAAKNPGMLGLGTYSTTDYRADLSNDIGVLKDISNKIGDMHTDVAPTDAQGQIKSNKFRQSYKTRNPLTEEFEYGLTAAGKAAKKQLDAVVKQKTLDLKQAKEQAAKEQRLEQERREKAVKSSKVSKSDPYGGGAKGGDGAFGGLSDRQADAAKGSKTESGKSIGGNPGDKSLFKSGGLAKQMKQSGLASKK